MGDLRTVAEHQQQILDSLRPLPPYDQPLLDALGLVAAADVYSPIALPSFDNSAMDGYAVRYDDVVGATDETPVHLPVVGEIGAGQARILAMSPGTAVKIMTGAPVPAGADAIVPYEWTDRGVAQVVISRAPGEGQHVRSAGEDVSEGDLLIEDGTLLGPRQLGLLASVGLPGAVVRPRPRVVIMSTGSELRDPGAARGHDSIYDGNSFMLAAAVRSAGAIAYRVGIVPDDPQLFMDALSDQLVRADVVITSGGVSMGDYDVVKEALSPLGTVWFGGVAMQPGKPQGFGVVGEDATPIFTLPGNPVSSFISFEMFVLPALRRMMGRLPYARPTVAATLTHAVKSPPGRAQYLRGELSDGPTERTARPMVSPVGGPGSHLVGDLAHANALIVVPAEATSVEAGADVTVIPLDQEF